MPAEKIVIVVENFQPMSPSGSQLAEILRLVADEVEEAIEVGPIRVGHSGDIVLHLGAADGHTYKILRSGDSELLSSPEDFEGGVTCTVKVFV